MNTNFLNLTGFFQPIFLVKIVTLIAIVFYAIFAFIVFIQVREMGKIVVLSHTSLILKTISVINIILAISLFLIALVIL